MRSIHPNRFRVRMILIPNRRYPAVFQALYIGSISDTYRVQAHVAIYDFETLVNRAPIYHAEIPQVD